MQNIFNVPTHRDGLRLPTLLAIDGSCPARPLLEALHEPIVDVPLVVSSMAHEQGMLPANHYNASTLNEAEFVAQLGLYFDENFGDGFGAQLAKHYEAEVAISPQKAWDAIAADIGVNCGSLEARSRHSPQCARA